MDRKLEEIERIADHALHVWAHREDVPELVMALRQILDVCREVCDCDEGGYYDE